MTLAERIIQARFAAVERGRESLHNYQSMAIEFSRANPFSLWLIDMGLGKTVSALTVASDILIDSDFQKAPILVIGPLKVACNVWPNEIGLWRHTAWMNHTLIRVPDDHPLLRAAARRDSAEEKERDAKRRALIASGMDNKEVAKALGPTHVTTQRHAIMAKLARSSSLIHIINREQVEWLVNLHGPKWPYRTVIVDESDSFKDHQSDRFKALAKVRRTTGLIEQMILMTATPASESFLELWAQVYLLDLGERLGKSITRYRDQWFIANKYNHTYKIKPGADEAILERIADITVVLKREDHLPTDKPTFIPRYVDLSERELTMIKSLERDLVLDLPDDVELEAKTAGHLANMLLQLASGALYQTSWEEQEDTDDLKKVKRTHFIHDHKIQALKELYESHRYSGQNLLVAYHFKSSLARLVKAFPKAKVMSRDGREEKDWNKGKIPMMFIHPQSAGHGLNLQAGGSTLVFFDMVSALRYFQQTVGRIDRQGQTKPVVIYLLLAKGSRDELAWEKLRNKEDAQDAFYKLFKKLIKQLKKQKEAELDS